MVEEKVVEEAYRIFYQCFLLNIQKLLYFKHFLFVYSLTPRYLILSVAQVEVEG